MSTVPSCFGGGRLGSGRQGTAQPSPVISPMMLLNPIRPGRRAFGPRLRVGRRRRHVGLLVSFVIFLAEPRQVLAWWPPTRHRPHRLGAAAGARGCHRPGTRCLIPGPAFHHGASVVQRLVLLSGCGATRCCGREGFSIVSTRGPGPTAHAMKASIAATGAPQRLVCASCTLTGRTDAAPSGRRHRPVHRHGRPPGEYCRPRTTSRCRPHRPGRCNDRRRTSCVQDEGQQGQGGCDRDGYRPRW